MSIFEDPISKYRPKVPLESQEIVIPLRSANLQEKYNEAGEKGIEISVKFADNPLNHIPSEFGGRFREIMSKKNWNWSSNQFKMHLPRDREIGVAEFFKVSNSALMDMLVEEEIFEGDTIAEDAVEIT